MQCDNSNVQVGDRRFWGYVYVSYVGQALERRPFRFVVEPQAARRDRRRPRRTEQAARVRDREIAVPARGEAAQQPQHADDQHQVRQ